METIVVVVAFVFVMMVGKKLCRMRINTEFHGKDLSECSKQIHNFADSMRDAGWDVKSSEIKSVKRR